MATNLPPRIDSFFDGFRRSAMLTAITTQVVIALLLGGLMWYMHQQVSVVVLIYILITSFLILEIVSTWLVVSTILKPTEIFSKALANAAGEKVKLPDIINSSAYEKNGLKSMIELINRQAALSSDEVVQAATVAESLLQLLPVGVIALDEQRRVVYCNEKAPIMVDGDGVRHPELLLGDEGDLDDWLNGIGEDLASDTRSWRGVGNRPPETEGRRVFDVVATYHKNATGSLDTILVTMEKGANYVTGEEDIDFIALAAHELRGPITVIRGYLDVLRDELGSALNPDQYAFLDRLNVSANNLSGYINNILNVSRYDRKHLKLYLREMRLEDIYDGLSDDLALRAKTRNRLLSVEIPKDLPTVAADRSSIGEVITNFVDNAIKYSNEGGQIVVKAEAQNDFVVVSVQDFGIGMPENVMQSLFTKFYRSHRSRESVTGTGLGLYISKAIVQSHGGSVSVRSTEGQGSTFSFTLPIYSTVADKLQASDNENKGIIETQHGWIKNHSMYRK